MKSNIIKLAALPICFLAFSFIFGAKVYANSAPDVYGYVKTQSGAPVPNIWVKWITHDDHGNTSSPAWRWVQTDSNGRFYFLSYTAMSYQNYHPEYGCTWSSPADCYKNQIATGIDTNSDGVIDSTQAYSGQASYVCDSWQNGQQCWDFQEAPPPDGIGADYNNGWGCGDNPHGFIAALYAGDGGSFSTIQISATDPDYASRPDKYINPVVLNDEGIDWGWPFPYERYAVSSGLGWNNHRAPVYVGTIYYTPPPPPTASITGPTSGTVGDNLTFTGTGYGSVNQVSVSWVELYYTPTSGQSWTDFGGCSTTSSCSETWNTANVAPGDYYVVDNVWDSAGGFCTGNPWGPTCGPNSYMVVHISPPPPSPPANLSASCPAPGTNVNLNWDSVSGATFYSVYAQTSDHAFDWSGACTAPNFCRRVSSPSTSFSPTVAGSNYTWYVTAGNDSGESSSSGGSFTCTPLCSPNTGNTCNVNACGVAGGTVQCDGSCSGGTPALPSGYGNSCTSSANACGTTNSGTINCSGVCSASTPANPSGYGNSCSVTSNANSCGDTTSNPGTIQCNGTCSATKPATPAERANYGNTCNRNACGGTGTIQCDGVTCSASAPACSLSVNLTVNGQPIITTTAPLNNVTASASRATSSGTTGTMNYTFWKNCNNATTNVSSAMTACGSIPAPTPGTCTSNAYGYKCDAVSTSPQTIANAFSYTVVGTYYAKVILEQGGLAAQDQTQITITNTAPTVSNLTADAPSSATYCGSPSQHFSWTFSDAEDAAQTSYQLQVYDNSDSSLKFDSGIVATSSTSKFVNIPPLAFNKSYRWQVQAFDSGGLSSGWVTGPSFDTPKHPYPQPSFTWSPASPNAGQTITFTDRTVFAPGSQNDAWSWNIPGATYVDGTSSANQNPHVTFASQQSVSVTLTSTDNAGSCAYTNTINIRPPLPKFKEIQPQ